MKIIIHIILTLFTSYFLLGQQVKDATYYINSFGQATWKIPSNSNQYYLLQGRHLSAQQEQFHVSMKIGKDSITTIHDQLAAYSESQYDLWAYDMANPVDTDGDGIDDVTEFNQIPLAAPFNASAPIDQENALLCLDTYQSYLELHVTGEDIPWFPILNGRQFVKFLITDIEDAYPKVYFINSKKYKLHKHFTEVLGIDIKSDGLVKGELIYSPTVQAANGHQGTFSFNFSVGTVFNFDIVQKTYETLARNMPLLNNNFSLLIGQEGEAQYAKDKALYDASRIPVLLEHELYQYIHYLALNEAESYGLLTLANSDITPGPKDIVIFESVPNNLPRVGGIITSFVQTPLSHVNLRAIQNGIPNAYIDKPLLIDSIQQLLGKYVHFLVKGDKYSILEASLEEVNQWHEAHRPTVSQFPSLDLSETNIRPLSEIQFDQHPSFGAKCANLGHLLSMNLQDVEIPHGYGIPFYYYHKFMEHNGLFKEIKTMLQDPAFLTDLDHRIVKLLTLREKIKRGKIPLWMEKDFDLLQSSFAKDQAIRVRSSSNNEDLPGFSGAGLYESKTHNPYEGNLSKTIKQVWASLWNFRAFEEREYFNIDPYTTSMAVICHPNFKEERANGVAITTDPIYNTRNTFYLNTQIGEDLVTNPSPSVLPEEILLDRYPSGINDFSLIRPSSLVGDNELIISESYINLLRENLGRIHDSFADLYQAAPDADFAVDVEFKITSQGRLALKQVRPWAVYWADLPHVDTFIYYPAPSIHISPNPSSGDLFIKCKCGEAQVALYNNLGSLVLLQTIDFRVHDGILDLGHLPNGVYFLEIYSDNNQTRFSQKVIKL